MRGGELFVDGDCEPKYVRIRVGLFGFGDKILIPLETVAVNKNNGFSYRGREVATVPLPLSPD